MLLLLAQSARADELVGDETIIVIDRVPDRDHDPKARDRDRALGDAPFVTIVHADDHPATASVADALGAAAGTQLRSLGGLGAYESITVRGAAPGHTSVLVDGVPLARLAAVTAELGRFSLDAFGQVELYRGAVPIELGGAGVGGAVNLVTRLGRGERGERIRASLGAGSFGSRHLHLHYGDAHRGGSLVSATSVGYQAAAGDYSFFSDNGTPLNNKDDAYEQRENNGFSQLDASSRIGTADRSAIGGVRLLWKDQGLPGTATQPSLEPNLATVNVLADGRADVTLGSAAGRQLGYVLVERQRLRDPEGEIGLGRQDRENMTLSAGATSTWRVPVGRHRLTMGVEARGDGFRDTDMTGMREPLRGRREGGAALAGLDLVLDPAASLVVTPAVRFDAVHTRPVGNGVDPGAADSLAPRWDQVPSPRISARAALTSDIAVKASAGRYVRLPTLVELFGNRGAIIGSPDLRPERGPSTDVGVVWAPAKGLGGVDRILVEASAFGTRSRDTIAFVSSVGYVARAMNVAASQTYGAELVASARVARALAVTANYTRLVTEQLSEEVSFSNKALPRQPAHAVYARIEAMHEIYRHRTSLWLDGSWQSTTYLDQANLMSVPARSLAGIGTRVEIAGGVSASVRVDNLFDVRVQNVPLDPAPRPDLTSTPMALADVAGFPLPGRTLYLALDWSH